MMLRDYLNEFELDWAQAAVRSGLIPGEAFRGANILLIGEDERLLQAIAWSFLAWNDEKGLGVRVQEARFEDGILRIAQSYGDDRTPVFQPDEAEYVILTGYCCRKMDLSVFEEIDALDRFVSMMGMLSEIHPRRLLLLSDGRVYGELAYAFAASEYEAGKTDTAEGFRAQYFLQALEGETVTRAREQGFGYEILRTGLIYGPYLTEMGNRSEKAGWGEALENPAADLAWKTAVGEEAQITLSPDRTSYICIHDVLTAIQFLLTVCPENKIFNVSGKQSDASAGEAAMLLYHNFPQQCRLRMCSGNGTETEAKKSGEGAPETEREKSGEGAPETEREKSGEGIPGKEPAAGALLNTQLLSHYGFAPSITLEDGLIILVKSLQQELRERASGEQAVSGGKAASGGKAISGRKQASGGKAAAQEVFIFDHTYYGKLETVQKILLGYLLEIDRICRKHNIKYFLAGGTLLGAIRHHGFIPWDDDADVMMLREDYEHFLSVAPSELPPEIFLQLPETEKGNYNPFTKLRINNTLFATEFTGHFMKMHNGIFFDVLAHDRTGSHRWSQKLHLMITMLSRSVVFNKWGNTDVKGGGRHPLICWIVSRTKGLIPMPLALWVQKRSLEFFRNRDTGYLYDGMGRNLKRGAFPAKWLDEAVYVDFEGYRLPVPKEYDKYLTWLYGDYMQMIPVSQRRTSHSIVLMDLGAYSGFELAHLPAVSPERTAGSTENEKGKDRTDYAFGNTSGIQ